MQKINHISTTEEILIDPFIRIEEGVTMANMWTNGHCKISRGTFIGNSKIEKYFAVGLFSFIQRCIFQRYITIGSRVSIGAFSHPTNWLSTLEFQFRNSEKFYGDSLDEEDLSDISEHIKETSIGSDVWIGDNAFVKSGIKIGHGAIIGAGGVVVKDVEPYSIVGGNPAKLIRKRFNDDIIQQLLEIEWWKNDIKDLSGIKFNEIEVAIAQVRALKQKRNRSPGRKGE